MSPPASRREGSHRWSLLLIGLFVLSYLIAGYLTLDATGRRVPIIAAAVTLVIVIAEWIRGRFYPGEDSEVLEGGGVSIGESVRQEILAIAFVAAGVAAIYFLGFMVAIPLYLFSSIAYLGKQPLRAAVIVSAIASLGIYVTFEVLLSYRLYPGVFFS